jgi:hypothetical protein
MTAKKPSSVHVIQITHAGKERGNIPPTILVYGNHTALMAGIKRLFENERRRLVQQAKFEKELGKDVANIWFDQSDAESFESWVKTFDWAMSRDLDFAAMESLNDIPDEFQIYQYTLTEERVVY